jgi:superoxide reductase
MERRDFIRLSVASVGAGIAAPTIVLANSVKQVKGASDIYYTKEDPGRWSGKIATHSLKNRGNGAIAKCRFF